MLNHCLLNEGTENVHVASFLCPAGEAGEAGEAGMVVEVHDCVSRVVRERSARPGRDFVDWSQRLLPFG